MQYHSIGKKPYMADFEVSDELAPDPFAEEPERHTVPHRNRYGQRLLNEKQKSKIKRKNENK